jgi:hypothetical protein
MSDDVFPPTGPDAAPAFVGLILGAIALFVILFSIVKITSGHYDRQEAAAAAAAPKN